MINNDTEFFIKLALHGIYHKEIQESINKRLFLGDREEKIEILLGHLKIEYLIEQIIKEQYPSLPSLNELKLTFYQKVKMIPNQMERLEYLIEPILNLNKIRNNYIHKLDFKIEFDDIKEIIKYMQKIGLKPEQNEDKPFENLKTFVKTAEFILLSETELLSQELKKLLSENRDEI